MYKLRYWNKKGKYQKLYNELWDKFVPTEGKADTKWGEIVRVVGRLYYDIYNNGGCNFDVFEDERLWLKNNMPVELRDSTKRFCTEPEDIDNLRYQEFTDKYMDAALNHAQSLRMIAELR